MLVDNSLSKKAPIDQKTVTLLSMVAHSIGIAVNNAKTYSSVLKESLRDDLTGLYNRRYFNERLIDEVDRSKRYGDTLSLLMVDIDNFKNINDTYGHPCGDDVLVAVSKVFQEKLRKTDLVARYGGEEFVIILFNTDRQKAVEIAENLRGVVAEATLSEENNVKLTVSIGISVLGEDTNSFDGLICNADKALYAAKARGRNRVCLAEIP